MEANNRNNLIGGAHYFVSGLRLLMHPKLRHYILVPLLVNCALFFALTSILIAEFTGFIDWIESFLPGWLAPLAVVVWVVAGVMFLIIYGYSFNVITNIIAAPFYGLLAEKTEFLLTGQKPPEEKLSVMIPRVMAREISKLIYFFLRGLIIMLLILLISLSMPPLGFLAPIIGLAWGAWSMSIQYADYAADNHQVRFVHIRKKLWNRKYSSFGFGGMVMACSVIPLLNIIAMPAAVTGGTIYWIKELRHCDTPDCL